jgi:hypothetical protein
VSGTNFIAIMSILLSFYGQRLPTHTGRAPTQAASFRAGGLDAVESSQVADKGVALRTESRKVRVEFRSDQSWQPQFAIDEHLAQ